jgi:large subunit ribosomal protein L1
VKEFAAGKVEFRNDAGGNVHAVVGKVSFEESKLVENIETFVSHIKKMKPGSAKGTYIKKVCISATMSPAVMVEV